MTDFFDRLEDQLVARSRALSDQPAAPVRRRPRLRPRHVAVAVAMLAIGGSALAGSEPWKPLLGDTAHGPQATMSQAAPPEAQLSILGVLRRGTTEADHGPSTTTALGFVGPTARDVRTRFIRLLSTGAGQGAAVLVPAGRYELASPGARPLPNALCVVILEAGSLGAGKSCFTTEQVASGTALGRSGPRVFGLVPDGVARVVLRYRVSPPTQARVHDNFFETRGPGFPHRVIWFDTAGRRIRVVRSG